MPGLAPTVDLNGSAPGSGNAVQFRAGGMPVALSPNALVTDPDTTDFAGGRLTLRFRDRGPADSISYIGGTTPDGLTIDGGIASFNGRGFAGIGFDQDGSGGVIVYLYAGATPEAVQLLLRRFTFSNQFPGTPSGNRSVDVVLTDDTGAVSATSTITVTVGGGSEPAAPVVTTSGIVQTFVESNDGTTRSVQIDSQINVSDADNGTLASATIRITGGYDAGQDSLRFFANPFGGNITGSWDPATGTLRLTSAGATARIEEWRYALSQVHFTNSGDPPSGTGRTISIVVSDGTLSSTAATATIAIQTTNDAPVLDLNGGDSGTANTIVYIEQEAPRALAPNATVADSDSANFDGGSLRVTYVQQQFPERGTETDVISIVHAGNGAGQVGVSGATVSFGGVAIGTFTGGLGGTTLVLTLNASATPAAVQAVVRSLTYYNGSDRPPNPGPSLTVSLTDGDGGTGSAAAYVSMRPVDDPTSLDLNGAAPGENNEVAYALGNQPVAIAPGARLSDIDNPDSSGGAAGGMIRVRVLNAQSGDSIGILNQGLGRGQISVHEDNSVAYEGMRIGTVYPATGQVIFDNQFVPLAAVEALVRATYFANANMTGSTATRTLEVVFTNAGRHGGVQDGQRRLPELADAGRRRRREHPDGRRQQRHSVGLGWRRRADGRGRRGSSDRRCRRRHLPRLPRRAERGPNSRPKTGRPHPDPRSQLYGQFRARWIDADVEREYHAGHRDEWASARSDPE